MCNNLCLVPGKKPGEYKYFCFSGLKIIDSPEKCSDGNGCPNYKDIDMKRSLASRIISNIINSVYGLESKDLCNTEMNQNVD